MPRRRAQHFHLDRLMTSQIGLDIQNKSLGFVKQRALLWKKYDAARQQERELNQYTGQFGSSNSSNNLPNLSPKNEPPDELAAAVWQLKKDDEMIKEAKSSIKSFQEEIKNTRKQFFIIAGSTITFFLFILIIMIS